jgi:hypothetical protein
VARFFAHEICFGRAVCTENSDSTVLVVKFAENRS